MKKIVLFLTLFTIHSNFAVLFNHVFDETGILSLTQKAQLEVKLRHYKFKNNQNLQIHLKQSLQNIEIESISENLLANMKEESNTVIVMANSERKIRVQSTSGISPEKGDQIIQLAVPLFRDAKYFEGLKALILNTSLALDSPIKNWEALNSGRSLKKFDWAIVLSVSVFLLMFSFFSSAGSKRKLYEKEGAMK